MDDFELAYDKLRERLDYIDDKNSKYIGSCRTCRHAKNISDLRIELRCFNPLVSLPDFDKINGGMSNGGMEVNYARSSRGLCGENGYLHQFSIFAFWRAGCSDFRFFSVAFGMLVVLLLMIGSVIYWASTWPT